MFSRRLGERGDEGGITGLEDRTGRGIVDIHGAQAILPLIGGGYSIFHDFPGQTADGTRFNIDHVLVGPAGAIIIETKAWSKNAELKTKESAVVRYDGQKLQSRLGGFALLGAGHGECKVSGRGTNSQNRRAGAREGGGLSAGVVCAG